jgi:diaminopimelate dehydrogenase
MNDKIKIAIVGYGNVGRGVHKAIKNNSDTIISGIITRRPEQVEKEVGNVAVYPLNKVPSRWKTCMNADVAILCGGSKNDLPQQGPYFTQFFNTVDSFDTHANIPKYFAEMDKLARENNYVSVISGGWDPGTFSLERVLADAFIPGAKHYTFWGMGVSQGHSDAARQVKGVKDARSYTIPSEDAIERARNGGNPDLTAREKHKRLVYVVAEEDADLARIDKEIKEMPNYFADYDTEVRFILEKEMKEKHSTYPHAGFVLASGKTGEGNKALIEYKCEWASNPEATGNILVACARAAYRLRKEGKSGAFTMLDIPASYFSPHSKEKLLEKFM